MSGDLMPLDGDNRYQAVQHNLKVLSLGMESAMTELVGFQLDMASLAGRSDAAAGAIHRANLDKRFVEMTNQVTTALGGTVTAMAHLEEQGGEVTRLADNARQTHSRKYQRLDDVRSSRRESTPKPGFFT